MVGISSFHRIVTVSLLGYALVAGPLEAGVVMTLRTTDYSAPTPRVEETRVLVGLPAGSPEDAAGVLKMDITSPGTGKDEGVPLRNHSLIFRGGEGSSITVIDHRRKSFSVIDHDSMAAFSAEMRLMMEASSMRIESLPPEQRELVRKMLEGQLGRDRSGDSAASGTMVRTGERDVLSGLPCVKYEVFQHGEKLREVWVTPPSAVRGGESALTLLREMSNFYGSLMSSLEKAAPGVDGGLRAGSNPFEDLERVNGFPVLTRNFRGGRVDTEVALLRVDEQSLSTAELEPPEGYSPVVQGAANR